MKSSRVEILLVVACCVSFLGCAGSGEPLYDVSGKVTMGDGKPVEGAAVSFIPDQGGEAAVGVTNAEGVYELMTRSRTGAMPGRYKVTIARYEGGADPTAATTDTTMEDPYDITDEYPDDYDEAAESNKAAAKVAKNVLPSKYSNPNLSGMSAEVTPGGENVFNFELTKR